MWGICSLHKKNGFVVGLDKRYVDSRYLSNSRMVFTGHLRQIFILKFTGAMQSGFSILEDGDNPQALAMRCPVPSYR